MLKGLKSCVAIGVLALAGCATQQPATPPATPSGLKTTNAPNRYPPIPALVQALTRPVADAAIVATPSVTLAWNAVTGFPTLAGYKVSQGNIPGTYTNTMTVVSTNVTINNLVQGNTYWFAVASYLTNGFSSTNSAPISYTVPFPNVATNNVAVVNFFGEASTSNQFTGWSAITNATVYWTNPPSPIFFRARMTIDYITGQP